MALNLHAAVEYDLSKGISLVGTNRISASALEQLVNNGTTATNKGMIIKRSTRPDIILNPRYTNGFLWLDTSLGTPGTLRQYVCCGDSDTNWVSGTIGVGAISAANLAEASVIAGKINVNAVNTTNISDNAITDTKVTAGAITSNKLASASVTSDKIVAGTIATANIGTNQITTALISDSQVTSNKLAPNAVLTATIADNSITTAKILDSNVTAAKLAAAAALGQVLRYNGSTLEWALPYALQETRSVSNALFTGSSVAAFDDTTLSLAETTNVLSVTITPLRSDTFIIVEAVINFSVNGANRIAAGIFRDGAGTASSVGYMTSAGNWSEQIKLYSKFSSSSTAATTFNIRMGAESLTYYVNGLLGARLFGGTSESWVTAREVSQ